jgi:hypothetical protein
MLQGTWLYFILTFWLHLPLFGDFEIFYSSASCSEGGVIWIVLVCHSYETFHFNSDLVTCIMILISENSELTLKSATNFIA